MKKPIVFAGLFLALVPSFALAGDVAPGSPAPKISVKKWIKGKPVNKFAPGKTYVVEFWATWCGPCIESIPHITELAKKNKDVTFVGVGIWEDNKDQIVEKFVSKMGAKMDYNIAYGGNKGGMADTWMKASSSNGIPTAFIVKNQKVMWIGHPMEMDKVLPQIKSGKYDLKKAAAAHKVQAEETKKQEAILAKIDAISKLYAAGKKDEAKAQLAELKKKEKSAEDFSSSMEMGWLAEDDYPAWEQKAKELAMGEEDSVNQLAMFAMGETENPKTEKAMRKAIELVTTNANPNYVISYYYLTMVHRSLKENDKALEMINRAIAGIPTSEYKGDSKMLEAFEKIKAEISKK
jgi:thiol-disulfide isomerase/thioredoxin